MALSSHWQVNMSRRQQVDWTRSAGGDWNRGLPEVAFNSRNLHGLSHHARQSERHLFWKFFTVHAGLQDTSQICQGLLPQTKTSTTTKSCICLAYVELKSIMIHIIIAKVHCLDLHSGSSQPKERLTRHNTCTAEHIQWLVRLRKGLEEA